MTQLDIYFSLLQTDKDEGVVEVQVITNDGHKLDESEVVISNSSILTNDADSQPEAAPK